MREFLLFLLFCTTYGVTIKYHERFDVEINVHMEPNTSRNLQILEFDLFTTYFMNPETSLCFEGRLNQNLPIIIQDTPYTTIENLEVKKDGLTLIPREAFKRYDWIVFGGFRVELRTRDSDVTGKIVLRRCKEISYVGLNNTLVENRTELYDGYDSTIRIPFYAKENVNTTRYIDFSSILPRGARYHGDWQRHAFCFNATSTGSFNLHLRRCLSRDPHTVRVDFTKDRQIARFWPHEEFLFYKHACPVEEEVLPDHLHVEIQAIDHHGPGQLVIYQCFHTFVTGNDGEEEMRIESVLGIEESVYWPFQYVVSPNRMNTYFAPLKHFMDTALLFGNKVRYSFDFGPDRTPYTISFSSCYNSTRYQLPINMTVNNKLTPAEVKMLSDFSNVLDCTENKHHGFYIHIGASHSEINDAMLFYTRESNDAVTPMGTLQKDKYTTVPFNLKKGDVISRNVHLYELLDIALNNNVTVLNMYFNGTGEVELSVSRCKYSPRLSLFRADKTNSFALNTSTVYYMFKLYNEQNCLWDGQAQRYEYGKTQNRGIYLHVMAFKDTVGYIAPYLTYKAKIMWHQLNEEHRFIDYEDRSESYGEVSPESKWPIPIEIGHLTPRVRNNKAVSFRFYIASSGPVSFGFTECATSKVNEWKKLTPLNNHSFVAWYTFDLEAVEYISALAQSPDCSDKKPHAIFVHLKADNKYRVSMEFSVVPGTDLNQVDPCHTAETVALKALEVKYHIQVVLLQIAILVLTIISCSLALLVYYTYKKFAAKRRDNDNDEYHQMISLASADV